MPLDFPNTPTDGQVYEKYKWNATDSVWELNLPEYVDSDTIIDAYLPTGSFVGRYISTEDLTVYTFNNIPVGDGGKIVLGIHSEASPETSFVSSILVDGLDATQVQGAVSSNAHAQIWAIDLNNPSSSAVTVVVNSAPGPVRLVMGVWKLERMLFEEPIFSGKDESISGSLSVTTSYLPEDSFVIAVATDDNPTPGAWAWTNATRRYNENTSENGSTFSGADATIEASGAITVTATTDSTEDNSMALAAFR